MSTLYIRLPSKAAAEAAEHWTALPCPFALASGAGAIEREGAEPLAQLADLIKRAQRVVLLIAASDVTLLRIQLPPLSGAKLRAALPNLVEDQIITDPAECVVVAGRPAEGLRTVAVMQRAWLDILHRTVLAYGARQIAALPAQLCLPYQEEGAAAAVLEQEGGVDVTLRLAAHEGIGLPILYEAQQAAPAAPAQEVVETLQAVVPAGRIALYVPQASVPAYRQTVEESGLTERIHVHADNWSNWIAGAHHAEPDLMTGLAGASGPKLRWKPWRWPLALAGLLLLVNVAAMNTEWWRMKSEADALRASMTQIYKKAYPKETVVIDPLAQMKQKIAAARHNAGQAAPDDFIALTAAFGEAWAAAGPDVNGKRGSQTNQPSQAAAAIAGLEYRERSLFVRFKEGAQPPAEQMKAALASHGLSLSQAPQAQAAQRGATVWQIRSGK